MNRIYQSTWNNTTGTFVAVSEATASAGKKSSHGASIRVGVVAGNTRFALKVLAISLMVAFGASAFALPVGGVVAQGGASISSAAGSTTIVQSSQNVAINWQSFSIGTGEAVRFVQPGSSAVALNRVLGPDPSSILGNLSANGKVFLVNPNGILFARGAQVNVGGLVAATLNITDSDFMAGRYRFAGSSDAAVLNQGTIDAAGGYVALMGASVGNDGTITARLGTVALAAGNAMTVDVAGDGLLNVTVSQGAVDALARNGGLIQADGGHVLLTSKSAGLLLSSAVNNTGVIQAQAIENRNGTIMLMGDMQSGTVNVGGKLDASAPTSGNGGFIETSAAHVNIADNTIIATPSAKGTNGTWLIDPFDFTIATAGGNITPAALAVALAGNVTISSNQGTSGVLGDINVNNDVTWSTATTLTLNAVRNLNFNANVTTTTGSLVATAGTDVIVNAMAGTGITTTDGSITWTAGRDMTISAGVVGGITATRGNITWISGRDLTINSAVTTTDGNFTACCGRDLIINSAMTMTRGHVVLRAGNDGSGVGVAGVGGTVVFGTGVLYTVTGATAAISDITIDSTPANYAVPNNYAGNFTGTASTFLTQRMLVFAKGNDKVYDGNTTATLSFKGTPTAGGAVTLIPGTGTFDSKNVAANIGINYTGYSLGGADAAKFFLWNACGAVAGTGRTSAAITPAPLTLRANDNTKVYGQTFNPATTAFTVVVAPVAGETVTAVTETSTGTPPTASVAGSTYPIVITPGSATGTILPANYTITLVDGALTVTPAPLTLRADDATKVFGTTFTPLATAFTIPVAAQNGETVTGITETSTGSPPAASVAGSTYPIVITPGSATGTITASNYAITLVNGALSVTPAPGVPPIVPPIVPPVAPPIATTPIATTPIETTPIETTPIEMAGLEPEEMMGPDTTLATTPGWPATVVQTAKPPELLALLPPVLPVEQPLVALAPMPVIMPAEAPPQSFAPPLRPRKQDRN